MKKFMRFMCLVLALVMISTSLVACKPDEKDDPNNGNGSSKADALVVMTDALDGLFNPFYATSGADMSVVGMTQLSMFTTGYENEEGTLAYGADEACLVLDYKSEYDNAKDITTYSFVLKNDVLFSDGHPMTMEDVLFNMYVYLDPVYTGSTTMYSTDIVGLDQYRTQKNTSGSGSSDLNATAYGMAKDRLNELYNLFNNALKYDENKSVDYDEMTDLITNTTLSDGYKSAIAVDGKGVTNAQLQEDYDLLCDKFMEELNSDYTYSKDAFLDAPYKDWDFDAVTSFMYINGLVDVEFGKKLTSTGEETEDKSIIVDVDRNYNVDTIKTQEQAVQYVYELKLGTQLNYIINYFATGAELHNEFSAKAKEVLLASLIKEDGSLSFANISGIKSLGHTKDADGEIVIDGNSYEIATSHNDDGTVSNTNQYDVLEIKVNGVDPKAIWNFAFTVAPQHYYAEGYTVDIENNEFGVEWGSFDYMSGVIQSSRNVNVPMGAGVYMATDANNNDNPNGNDFFKNNVVYYKANENFLMGKAKIEKYRYQVVSSSNALGALENGSVHFVTPQYTSANVAALEDLEDKGIESLNAWQLGYGYIGVNAGKVKDVNLRRAIMTAMDTSLALSYYKVGTAETIAWPMSTVSWAYPRTDDGQKNNDNGHDYTMWTDAATAKASILDYMAAANVSSGDKELKITFTIAGSNLTDHPTYSTFRNAADLLNECGWNIEVLPDVNALNKLSTGSLAVWAAAWGSTIDPDMYQVYHMKSTATSVKSWGYEAILNDRTTYQYEYGVLQDLSEVIDDARETNDQDIRTGLYEEAMGYVLDLAVELPVYQRKELYAYNAKVIDSSTLPETVNPYTSPLDRLWEIEFAK